MDSIEFAACGFFVAAATLLEEAGDVVFFALAAEQTKAPWISCFCFA